MTEPKMSDRVVSLRGGPIQDQRKPDGDVVDLLMEALERARSGETTGVFISEVWCDGSGSFGYAGNVAGYSILGAIDEGKTVMREAVRVHDD